MQVLTARSVVYDKTISSFKRSSAERNGSSATNRSNTPLAGVFLNQAPQSSHYFGNPPSQETLPTNAPSVGCSDLTGVESHENTPESSPSASASTWNDSSVDSETRDLSSDVTPSGEEDDSTTDMHGHLRRGSLLSRTAALQEEAYREPGRPNPEFGDSRRDSLLSTLNEKCRRPDLPQIESSQRMFRNLRSGAPGPPAMLHSWTHTFSDHARMTSAAFPTRFTSQRFPIVSFQPRPYAQPRPHVQPHPYFCQQAAPMRAGPELPHIRYPYPFLVDVSNPAVQRWPRQVDNRYSPYPEHRHHGQRHVPVQRSPHPRNEHPQAWGGERPAPTFRIRGSFVVIPSRGELRLQNSPPFSRRRHENRS